MEIFIDELNLIELPKGLLEFSNERDGDENFRIKLKSAFFSNIYINATYICINMTIRWINSIANWAREHCRFNIKICNQFDMHLFYLFILIMPNLIWEILGARYGLKKLFKSRSIYKIYWKY